MSDTLRKIEDCEHGHVLLSARAMDDADSLGVYFEKMSTRELLELRYTIVDSFGLKLHDERTVEPAVMAYLIELTEHEVGGRWVQPHAIEESLR